MSDNFDEIREAAYEARARWLRGELTLGETKKLLQPYIAAFNEKSAELAAKYQQKPQRLRVSEFLRNAP